MKLIIKEQQESYENKKACYIFKEKFEKKNWKIKNIVKLKIILLMQENIKRLGIAYVI